MEYTRQDFIKHEKDIDFETYILNTHWTNAYRELLNGKSIAQIFDISTTSEIYQALKRFEQLKSE